MKLINMRVLVSLCLVVCLFSVMCVGSMAYFTDRIDQEFKGQAAIFSKAGYSISREVPSGSTGAGETVTVPVSETNTKEEDILSFVTLSAAWDCSDGTCKPWGNPEAADNMVIKCEDDVMTYTLEDDGTITFDLPEHILPKSSADPVIRDLQFVFPDSLPCTGELDVTLHEVTIQQAPYGFSQTFSSAELNGNGGTYSMFTVRPTVYNSAVVPNVSETMTYNFAEALIAFAEGEIGYAESEKDYILNEKGRVRGFTKYGDYYGMPYADWCAMFIGYCMDQVGLTGMPYAAGCENWRSQAKQAGLYYRSTKYVPSPGDIVFMDLNHNGKADHVGIIVEFDLENGTYTAIEGNYHSTVTKMTRELNSETLGYMSVSGTIILKETEVPVLPGTEITDFEK